MGYARYVGRVGALAVALGIGVAVSNSPAIAQAQESTAAESSAASDSPSDAGASSDTGASADVDNGSSASDEDEAEDKDEDDAEEDADPQEPDPQDTDDHEAGEQEDTDTPVEVSDTKTTVRRDHAAAQKPPVAQVDSTAGSDGDGTRALSAPARDDEPASESVASHPRPHSDIASDVTSTEVTASAVAATVSSAAVTAANPAHSFVTSVLSWFGITPQATTIPAAPAESPAAWAILAWLRREFIYTLFNRSPVLKPVQTGQSPTGEITGLLNGKDFQDAPLVYSGGGSTTRGSVVIDPTTGAFTYTPDAELTTVGGTDTFVVTASNTAAYRLPGLLGVIQAGIHHGAQLLGLAQPDSTSTVVEVTVIVSGLSVISEIRTAGDSFGPPVLSADGTRTYRTTRIYNMATGQYTTRVSVVDTITGALLGSPVVIAGEPGDRVVSQDGTRLTQTSEAWDEDADTYTTTVAVIDTATGALVGSPVIVDGHRAGHLQLSDDGARAFQTTQTFDSGTRTWTTTVAVVDTSSGVLVNTPIVVDGSFRVHVDDLLHPRALVFNADGTRAFITTQNLGSGVDATIPEKSTVAVIDTATGSLVGAPIIIDGLYTGPTVVSKDGTRAYVVTRVDIYFTNTATTRVAVLDAHTGTLVAAPLELPGYAIDDAGSPDSGPVLLFSPDGSHAFVSTDVWNPVTFAETTRVAMIDAVTAHLVSTTVLEGRGRGPLQQSDADPTRFIQITVTDFGTRIEPATTQLATISAIDGSVIGIAQTPGIDDNDYPMQFSADGTRAYLLTTHQRGLHHQEPADAQTLYVLIVDTATGTQVGAPLELPSAKTVAGDNGYVQFSDDGTRTFQIIAQRAAAGVGFTNRMLVIDTADGALLGSTELLGALVGHMEISDDGTRVYQTTVGRLIVIDGVTGARVASTPLDGSVVGGLKFGGSKVGDPGYLAVVRTVTDPVTAQTRTETAVVVINTVDGSVTETWTPQPGSVEAGSPLVLNADGSRLYLVTSVHDPATDTYTTVVGAYSTGHGAPIGTPITVQGPPRGPLLIGADGSRVVLPLNTWDPQSGHWRSALAVLDTHVGTTVTGSTSV